MSCKADVTEIVIPSTVCDLPVVSVGYGIHRQIIFRLGSALKTIYIPDTIIYISDSAFLGCTNLTYVRLSLSIKHIGADGSDGGEYLFDETSVTFLDIPEGVTSIGFFTFDDSDIESLILPSTLTRVYHPCFSSCPLKEVFFRGTKDQCAQDLLSELETYTNATIYYLSETEPTEEGNFWHYVDGKPVIW